MGILKNNVLENFPYLEDDFDALTDYELFCKLIGIKVDYEMLPDKPKINGIELVGDSSLDKLDIERKITSSNKLNADLVSDTSSTNKFVTATDKTTWNGKQNAITSSNKLASDLVTDTDQTNKFVTSTDINNWNGKQNAITSDSKLSADLVSDTDTTNKFVTSTDINNWNGKSDFSGSYDDLTDKPTIPSLIVDTVSTTGVVMTSGTDYYGNITLSPPAGYELVSIIVSSINFADANFVQYNYAQSAGKIYYKINCGYNNGSSVVCTFKLLYKK